MVGSADLDSGLAAALKCSAQAAALLQLVTVSSFLGQASSFSLLQRQRDRNQVLRRYPVEASSLGIPSDEEFDWQAKNCLQN
jgi:hypothetical protein